MDQNKEGRTKNHCWHRPRSAAAEFAPSLTDFLRGRNGRPGGDVEAHDGRHAGHVFAAALAVLHEDVDLAGLEPHAGVDAHDAARPARGGMNG